MNRETPFRSAAGQAHKILAETFGFDSFKPNQEAVINAVLEGRDVFAAMPTGGGKSLCYQLPAMVFPGLTLVISPLIALMKDQTDAARVSGIPAVCLNSSVDSEEAGSAYRELKAGTARLLYIAPERLSSPGFTEMLSSLRISSGRTSSGRTSSGRVSLIAVDEAHCISEWGHEFRPDYRQLSKLREHFPGIPIAAFTATATGQVQRDIIRLLKLKSPFILRAGFNRPELYYRVAAKTSADRQILEFILNHKNDPGIVYRSTRKDVEKTAAFLASEGVKAAPYHAGLSDGERRSNQTDFKNDRIRVIVATIAFGMGIDKPNIRFVLHADLPRSVEGYYQETGRAGRDGKPADCLLLYGRGDIVKIRFHIDRMKKQDEKDKALLSLEKMSNLARRSLCRRVQILSHFDEDFAPPCGNCDVCRGTVQSADATEDAGKFLSAVLGAGQRFGAHYVTDIVTGADTERIRQNGHHKIPAFGAGSDKDKSYWLYLTDELEARGFLSRTDDRYRVLSVTAAGRDIVSGRLNFTVAAALLPAGKAKPGPSKAADSGLLLRLKNLRTEIARKNGRPPYMIFSDKTLKDMCVRLPKTEAEMLEVNGVGPVKMAAFGGQFLKEIRNSPQT